MTLKYILMHSVIFRTKLLRECGLRLPEHTFYVDNIFVFQPLPYVKTINEKQIIKDITANITNSKKTVLMNDAIFALVLLSKRRVDIQSVIVRVVSYVEFSYDPEIRISLQLLTRLVKDKKLNQKSQQRIYALLNRLAEKIPDCNLDYEYLTDFNYFTLMLAGSMKSQYGARPATDKWEEIYNDENQFNDVKRGFEKGLS